MSYTVTNFQAGNIKYDMTDNIKKEKDQQKNINNNDYNIIDLTYLQNSIIDENASHLLKLSLNLDFCNLRCQFFDITEKSREIDNVMFVNNLKPKSPAFTIYSINVFPILNIKKNKVLTLIEPLVKKEDENWQKERAIVKINLQHHCKYEDYNTLFSYKDLKNVEYPWPDKEIERKFPYLYNNKNSEFSRNDDIYKISVTNKVNGLSSYIYINVNELNLYLNYLLNYGPILKAGRDFMYKFFNK